MLGTIERTGQLLKLFTLETPVWRISEMAQALNCSTSTTYDLASSLVQIGLLKQSADRRYEIGWRVFEMSQVVLGSSSLQAEARKGMTQLSRKFNETVLLGVSAGGKILFADKISPKQSLFNSVSPPDMRFQMHCTAAGKVIMAHLTEEERESVLKEHGFEPLTPHSVPSRIRLDEELAEVVTQGYATAYEEAVIGLGCIAAPIVDYSGGVVASLCLAAEIDQFGTHFEAYRRDLVQIANQVSRRLGGLIFD